MTDSRTLLLGLASLSLACASGVVRRDSGVAVGNPGNLRVSIAPGDDVRFTEGRIYIGQLWLLGCDGREQEVAADRWLELGERDAVAVPKGAWCGVLAESMRLEATGEGERDVVELSLEIDSLALLGSSWNSADGDVLMRLADPGWVSAEWLEVDDRELTDELVDIIVEESALVRDLNGNAIDDDEPELGIPDEEAFDWEEEEEEPVEDIQEGCHATGRVPGSAGALVLLLGLFGRRRRQGDRPTTSRASFTGAQGAHR